MYTVLFGICAAYLTYTQNGLTDNTLLYVCDCTPYYQDTMLWQHYAVYPIHYDQLYTQLAYFPMVLKCIFLNVRCPNRTYKWRALNKEVCSLHRDPFLLKTNPPSST